MYTIRPASIRYTTVYSSRIKASGRIKILYNTDAKSQTLLYTVTVIRFDNNL